MFHKILWNMFHRNLFHVKHMHQLKKQNLKFKITDKS
jgi:hypothetical protein